MKSWALLALLIPTSAMAFDPFTVAAVASTTFQAVSSVSEAAGEVSSTADAFNELYSEIDTDAAITSEGQKLISEIQEVDSLAKEAGYTADEIDSLAHQDPDEMRKLASTLRALTRAVKAGKRAFRLVMKLDQKAKMAAVESAQLEKEQLAAMYKMVRLQQEANLEETKRDLKDLINKRKQISSLREELKNKGVKTFGATGVLSFPRSERVVENAIQVANKLRAPLLSMMLVIFLTRLVFYQFGFFGVNRTGDLVRDTILCALLLMIYPEIVRATVKYTMDIAAQIGEVRLHELRPKEIVLPVLKDVATSTKMLLLWGFEWLKYGAFAIIDFIMTFGIAFMVMLFPIVIFASQMMNFAVAWPIFLGSFITIALWPLFWNLVGMAADLSWGQTQRTFAESLYSIFFTLLQLVSPALGIKLLSGQHLSKALSDGVKTLTNPISQFARQNSERKDAAQKMNGNKPEFSVAGQSGLPSVGRMLGSTQGYLSNQIQSRKAAHNESKGRDSPDSNGPKKVPVSPRMAAFLNSSSIKEGKGANAFLNGFKAKPIKRSYSKQKGTQND